MIEGQSMDSVVARTLIDLWPDSGDFAVIVVAGGFYEERLWHCERVVEECIEPSIT